MQQRAKSAPAVRSASTVNLHSKTRESRKSSNRTFECSGWGKAARFDERPKKFISPGPSLYDGGGKGCRKVASCSFGKSPRFKDSSSSNRKPRPASASLTRNMSTSNISRKPRPQSASLTRSMSRPTLDRSPGPVYNIKLKKDHKMGKFGKGKRFSTKVEEANPAFKYNHSSTRTNPRSETGGKMGKNDRMKDPPGDQVPGCDIAPKSFSAKGDATATRNNANSFGKASRFKHAGDDDSPGPDTYSRPETASFHGIGRGNKTIVFGKDKRFASTKKKTATGPNYNSTEIGSKYGHGPPVHNHGAHFSKAARPIMEKSKKGKAAEPPLYYNPKPVSIWVNGKMNRSGSAISWGKPPN